MCTCAVPEVSFESSSYRADVTENLAVPVCLSYDNTGGGYAQFSVNISVATEGKLLYMMHIWGVVQTFL